jgi:RimJ/RimL family protein N-acetyltransferase
VTPPFVLENVARILAESKRSGAEADGIPVGSLGLRLVPVTPVHLGDDRFVERLARWRAAHMDIYPTQFRVTTEGTRAWLRDRIIGAEGRIMFVVTAGADPGDALAHMGFDHALEAERTAALSNVVRGDDLPRGGIQAGLEALFRWGHERLGLERLWATPFSDNTRSVQMLERAGFAGEETIPLRRLRLEDERVEYRPIPPGDDTPPDRVHLLMWRRLP